MDPHLASQFESQLQWTLVDTEKDQDSAGAQMTKYLHASHPVPFGGCHVLLSTVLHWALLATSWLQKDQSLHSPSRPAISVLQGARKK